MYSRYLVSIPCKAMKVRDVIRDAHEQYLKGRAAAGDSPQYAHEKEDTSFRETCMSIPCKAMKVRDVIRDAHICMQKKGSLYNRCRDCPKKKV